MTVGRRCPQSLTQREPKKRWKPGSIPPIHTADIGLIAPPKPMGAVVWSLYSQLKNDNVVLSLITIPLANISGLAYVALSATV